MAANGTSIPGGIPTQVTPVIPPDIRQRYGITEDLHAEYWDTNPAGIGMLLNGEDQYFVNNRGGNPYLSNLEGVGFLLNNKQFLLCGIYVHTFFSQPFGTEPPVLGVDVTRLYDLYNTYTYAVLKLGDTDKMEIPMHRLPSGGGVYGFNNNVAALTLTQGVPQFANVFFLKNPLFIGLNQKFTIIVRWGANLPGMAIPPLTQFNSNTTAEKVIRVGLVGIEGRNWTN